MKYSYIDSDTHLRDLRGVFSKNNTKTVCMDFEGEFNLHCYGEKLCLIQVYDGQSFYVIDPFPICTSELKKTLESDVVKLFYSAGSDRKLVFRQYGIRIKALFDIADLVDVIGLEHKGLGDVIEEILSIRIEKKRKYQRYNWTRRPIAEDAIQYALSDVKYLFDLQEALLKIIKEADLPDLLVTRLAKTEFDYEKKTVPRVKKKSRYKRYTQERKAMFDMIFRVREKFAKEIDKPPNSVIPNEQLFHLAEKKSDIADICFGKPVPIEVRKRIVKEISELLADGPM